MGNEFEQNDPLQHASTHWQHVALWFLVDVLISIVVLNLAAEFVSTIMINHFSISIFVAFVLTAFLYLIQYLEHQAQHFFCVKLDRKFLGLFFMWLIVFLSKFVILWIDDVIFGSNVSLGKFWSILILSAVLMLSEKLSRFLYQKLGEWELSRINQVKHDEIEKGQGLQGENGEEIPGEQLESGN